MRLNRGPRSQPSNERRRFRPQFLSVNDEQLATLSAALVDRVRDMDPDLLIGLATGGVYVADAMRLAYGSEAPPLVTLRIRRPSTATKERLSVDAVLSRLPTKVSYLLRWVEVELRECALSREHTPEPVRSNLIRPTDGALIAKAERVLIVDDTVDSGRTLSAAVATVKAHNPRCQVRTATIASTWRRPPVTPEYVLLPRTLVRFGWSLDTPTVRQ
jgi:hypoxanthine phosphoribosyltransferase